MTDQVLSLDKYCPKCGEELNWQNSPHKGVPICTNNNCGYIFWQNSKPSVCAVIIDDTFPDIQNQRIIMGYDVADKSSPLGLPGGYLELGEDPAQGILRELSEELPKSKIKIRFLLDVAMSNFSCREDSLLTICFVGSFLGGTLTGGDDFFHPRWVTFRELYELLNVNPKISQDRIVDAKTKRFLKKCFMRKVIGSKW